ncbi:AAA family ATPase [Pedobacter sp. P351]|uniref:AAA family ATPase n=1 Tax=Pedobacter superstes TaxID=3133441 RepID=UPI0030A6F160
MALKINKFHIENFKIFERHTFDFRDRDFLIFDGPNGFGKTSFYDAVELLLTGKIRRYRNLADIIVDNREIFTENPYLNASFPLGDILIKAELLVDGHPLVLSRCCLNKDLENSVKFDKFLLYSHDSFEDRNGILIDDENAFLQPFLGKDYVLNFQFLNYVEQEDNAYLLKNKEAAKKKAIDHLFNVEEFQSKLDKVIGVRKSIWELCKPQVKRDLKADKDALKAFKEEWAGKMPEVQYQQMFATKALPWDGEQISFEPGVYEFLLGPTGELVLLKELVRKKDSFLATLFNRRLESLMHNTGWENFLKYWYFLEGRDELVDAAKLFGDVDGLYKEVEEITVEKIDREELNIPENVTKVLPEELVSRYHSALEDLEFKLKQANGLKKILASLEASRSALIRNFENYREILADGVDNNCPLCGQKYGFLEDEDAGSLMANIALQTIALQGILDDSNNDLSKALQSFRESEVAELEVLLDAYIKTHLIDISFVRQLARQKPDDLESLNKSLMEIDVEPTPFLNKVALSNAEIDLEVFQAVFTSKMIPIEGGVITSEIKEIYLQLFNGSEDLFEELSEETVDRKIAYVQWQHSLYKNTVIQQREKGIEQLQQQYDQASNYVEKMKDLEQAYSSALSIYQKSLIRDIEILFHIYSGRIIQDFQGGLGLFIKEDRGIKFLTDSSKSFDAVFTMSSGQIAALVISFTLALNKKYSRNKVLLIDDPVQTMDELNIAGFVELLRNDFGDRQIFISTHEDKMSNYMRYKFEKFGLKSRRVSMKSAQLG